jgi:superfamily II DNA or RNA helicase
MRPIIWRDLDEAFHELSLQRGLDYARGGHVVEATIEPVDDQTERVTARVRGSAAVPYKVQVDVGRAERRVLIESRCDCPVGYNCKHGAAALIAAYDIRPPQPDPPPVPRSDARAEFEELMRQVIHLGKAPVARPSSPAAAHQRGPHTAAPRWNPHSAWIGRVRALYAPPAPAPERRARMVYAIGAQAHGVRPTVTPLYGNARKDGSLASLRPTQSDLGLILVNRPQYLGDDDARLIKALALAAENRSFGEHVLERDSELLRQLVEQGRAVVKNPAQRDYVPLRLTAARPARARWEADATGRQRFALEVDPPARVLVLDGLWYLDAQRAEFGPVAADVDPALAEVLLTAPPVEVAQAAEVARELDAALAALPVAAPRPPLPSAIAVRALREKAVVHLRLANITVVHYLRFTQQSVGGAAAFVHVRYGDLPVHLNDTGSARMHDGALVAPVIDPKVHSKTLNRLHSTGFHDMPDAPEQQAHESGFFLHESLVLGLMHEAVPRWRKAGWVVTLAPDFAWQPVEAGAFFIDAEAQADERWFELELGVQIEGERVSLLPVLQRLLDNRELRESLLAEGSKLQTVNVRLDERRILPVPAERLRTILRTLVELNNRPPSETGQLRLARTDAARLVELTGAGFEWRGAEHLRRLGERLATFSAIAPVAPPPGLRAELRPYQLAGLAWLQFLREYELAGILADDMGLGKTVQAIAHLLLEKDAGRLQRPALVLAPTSVVHNWQAECARFAPQLKTLVLHGLGRHAAFTEIGSHDVVLTTYPLLSRDIDELIKHEFHIAIFDEAQNLKNAKTRAAEAAGRLRATHRLALTGTPLENNLAELWSQFNLLLPGFLGDSRRFAQLYRTPIEKHGDSARRAHLARRLKPFILRRNKDMVARELPPKTEIEQTVDLAGAQRDLYETVRASMQQRVRDALAKQGLARSHIVVLDALLKLRQVCCDPRLVPGPAAKKVRESAKLERLAEMLPELVAEGRRILLFSQFTSMLALIEQKLAELKIDYVQLTGDTKDRKTPIERFQRGEVPVFLISLKAGGTGLNLTAADTVIHYDPWWNPAVENQATDRAHRIGQDKPVFVHRLIAAGTVEERIRALQARKADLARGILDDDAAVTKALSADDVRALFEAPD